MFDEINGYFFPLKQLLFGIEGYIGLTAREEDGLSAALG